MEFADSITTHLGLKSNIQLHTVEAAQRNSELLVASSFVPSNLDTAAKARML